MSMSDGGSRQELLEQALRGDETSLGRLLESHRSYLLLLARLEVGRHLRVKVDPADVVQDTFLEASRGFGRFRGRDEVEFAAWLRQILASSLSHLMRRYLGTEARDLRLERSLAHNLDQSSRSIDRGLVAMQSSPSQRASRREQALILADALERLPPDYREVIVLRHLEGLTFPGVAERMNRTLASVEKLWARAVGRLKASLEAHV